MKKSISIAILSVTCLIVASCGGGSSSSDGVVFEGTLRQGSGVTHSERNNPRHSAGEPIEEVDVCAFGECSMTDSQGQWGFLADSFTGGEVLFSIVGHGIDDTFVIEIPRNAKEVTVALENNRGQVSARSMTVNGELYTSEHSHSHE